MLNTAQLKHQAKILFDSVSFLTHIENESEYNAALELMDELIDDYDDQKPLINLLSLAINEWEENSNEFKLFNHEIEKLDNGLSVLRVLIEQHGLHTTDFKEEIGGKSMVSMILNGKRKLSLDHIRALSQRFNVAPQVFI